MIDDDVLGLDVSVHNALTVCEVKPLEDLIDVVLAVAGSYYFEQLAIVGGCNVLHHQAVDLSFANNVQQLDAVVPAP